MWRHVVMAEKFLDLNNLSWQRRQTLEEKSGLPFCSRRVQPCTAKSYMHFFRCFFFCHISSTADCWDPEIMLPWQRDLTPCLHYGGRGGWYQPRWMTLFSRRCYLCPYKRLILGKGAFFILVFLNMITNPIISQTLNFCDVAPLFSVLLKIV